MNNNEGQNKKTLGACERCGNLVVLTKFTLCYNCRRLEKQEMDKALEYLRFHRGASLNQIANATGVDSNLILKLIHSGIAESQEKDIRDKIRKKQDELGL